MNDVVEFEGAIELPVPVGVRGGAIQTHPLMKYTHGLLGTPDCAVCLFRLYTPHCLLFNLYSSPFSYDYLLRSLLL